MEQNKNKDNKKEKDEYLAGWQRCKADLENYKKNEAERIRSAVDFAEAECITGILEIIDNLERAEEHIPNELKQSEWVKGILRIQGQFYKFLKERGVEEIKAIGKKFNPHLHEAMIQVEAKGKEPNIVVEVLKKGYNFKGRVLRPAKVKISK